LHRFASPGPVNTRPLSIATRSAPDDGAAAERSPQTPRPRLGGAEPCRAHLDAIGELGTADDRPGGAGRPRRGNVTDRHLRSIHVHDHEHWPTPGPRDRMLHPRRPFGVGYHAISGRQRNRKRGRLGREAIDHDWILRGRASRREPHDQRGPRRLRPAQ
jgi:hypothetical protein